jgi:hypothetical protein
MYDSISQFLNKIMSMLESSQQYSSQICVTSTIAERQWSQLIWTVLIIQIDPNEPSINIIEHLTCLINILPERCFHFAWTLFPFCLNAFSILPERCFIFVFCGDAVFRMFGFCGDAVWLYNCSVASQWGPDAVWILPRRYLVICLR